MALYGYYFNSMLVNGEHDRTYNAESFCEFLKGIISDGVLANPSNNLQVTANYGMNIVVKAGEGWISGHKMLVDADYQLAVATADTALNRIDRVVFALNKKDRVMQIYVKTGTPASSPVAPGVVNTSELIELSLATITVNKNTSVISQSMIKDTRYDTKVCGIVHSLIEQLDTSTTFAQYDDAFNTWFASLKEDLVSNTIFIEKKSVYTTSVANTKTIAIPTELLYGDALDVLHVYVNGFRLVEGVQYTKTDTTITFTPVISAIGTKIEITNWKTMGSDDVQSAVEIISDLESKMAHIQKYRYDCVNTDDNIAIMEIINNFINGTGQFGGVGTYSQLELSVHGRINLSSATSAITTTNCNGYFAIENTSTKRVILDLSNAEIYATLTANAGINAIFDIYMDNFTIKKPRIYASISNNNIDIIRTKGNVEGGNIYVGNNSSSSVRGLVCKSIDTHQTIKDTDITLYSTGTESNANNIYGFVGRESETDNVFECHFINCSVKNTTGLNTHYGLFGFGGYGVFDNCSVNLYNYATEVYGVAYGFSGGGYYTNCQAYVVGNYISRGFVGNGKFVNCKAHAATNTSNACSGFNITGEATNCEGIGRNASTGSGYGFILNETNAVLKLVNCKGYGYTGTGAASTEGVRAAGIGVGGNSTGSTIICIGCECPKKDRTYQVQKESILIFGNTSGPSATLIGNVIFEAITKHSGSNISESGNIIIS